MTTDKLTARDESLEVAIDRLESEEYALRSSGDSAAANEIREQLRPLWAKQHGTDPILLSVRLMGVAPGSGGYSEWLKVIHAINTKAPATIGQPIASYDWWARGWTEEYPEFRVILKAEGDWNRNYVQAKTPGATVLLRWAVAHVTGNVVDNNGMTVRRASDEERNI